MGLIKLKYLILLLVLAVVRGTDAATYVVGDSLGWTIPSGGAAYYATWAAQHTFAIGDKLVFNFATGAHDVATVTKDAFGSCSSTGPTALQTVSPVNVTLTTAGAHYFICTFGQHCSLGQKLSVNVTSTSAGPSTSPSTSPPTAAPPPTAATPPPTASTPTRPPTAASPTTPPTAASPTMPPTATSPTKPPTAASPTPRGSAPGPSTVGGGGPTPPPSPTTSPPAPSTSPPPTGTSSPPSPSSASRKAVATLAIGLVLVVMGVVC